MNTLEIREDNIYDQSITSIERQFYEHLDSPEWLSSAVNFFQNQKDLDRNIQPKDRGLVPHPLYRVFRLPIQYKGGSVETLYDHFEKTFAENPTIIFQLPDEYIGMVNDKQQHTLTMAGSPIPRDFKFEVEDKEKINTLRKLLNIPNTTQFQDYEYAQIIGNIKGYKNGVERLSYYYFCLESAKKIIIDIGKDFANELDNINKNLIMAAYHFKTNAPFGGHLMIEDKHILYISAGLDIKKSPKIHGFGIEVLSHEYIHAILDSLLDYNSYYSKKNQECSLMKVLGEAATLSFEYEFEKRVSRSTIDSNNAASPMGAIRSLGDNRKEVMRRFKDKKFETLDSEEQTTFIYYEGAVLAQKLAKKGWRFQDLRELIEQIKQVVDVKELDSIQISSDENSEYQQTLQKILNLIPPNTKRVEKVKKLFDRDQK